MDLAPPKPAPPALLPMLEQTQALAASRDREQLARIVLGTIGALLSAHSVVLHRVHGTPQGYLFFPIARSEGSHIEVMLDEEGLHEGLSGIAALEDCLAGSEGLALAQEHGYTRVALAIGPLGEAHAVVEALSEHAPDPLALDAALRFIAIYHAHLQLLDYAELDTLTKLSNRKTFDENFDRFIAIAERAQKRCEGERRREDDITMRPCWIGVIDIDRFKRINDNFGHLFGDEVLLRVAEVMKRSFRMRDKLFRFGGEEFVVLLRHVSPEDADAIFNRFRIAVEHHEFPQVGQVTCSMGYVQIHPATTPAELLGQADEALYFSKENGRNQVNGYEALVAQGLLAGKQETSNADLQADIDALFG